MPLGGADKILSGKSMAPATARALSRINDLLDLFISVQFNIEFSFSTRYKIFLFLIHMKILNIRMVIDFLLSLNGNADIEINIYPQSSCIGITVAQGANIKRGISYMKLLFIRKKFQYKTMYGFN